MNQSFGPVSDPSSLLRSLLGSSGDCIKILDLDGNLVFMTEGGQRVMEVTDVSAIYGCAWPDFWRDQGNLDALNAVKTARGGKAANFKGYATTMAGTPRWWDVTVTPIVGADGKPEQLLSVSRDITASHLADVALRASERRLRLALNAGRLGHWELDLASGAMAVSDICRKNYGRDRNTIFTLQLVRDAVHPDDRARMEAGLAQTIASGDDFDMQYRIVRPDGGISWMMVRGQLTSDDNGRPTVMSGVSLDISEMKSIGQALIESEQRVAAALSAADTGTWDLDPRSGLLRWDRRCYELFGLAPDKPISFGVFLEGLHPDDRDPTEKACLDAMKPEGTRSYDIEYRTIGLDDGIERWCSAKGRAYFENDEPVRFIGTIRDIGILKRAEAQQLMLTRELEHRMKNTMAMVGAIANQTFRTANSKEEARTIFDARLHALNTAHDVLTQSSWTSASMPTVVEGALAPHRSGEKRIHCQGPDIELTAKQALSLSLALHELATNAAKYGALSVPGGTIDITWDCIADGADDLLRFAWRESGGPTVTPPTRRGFGSRLIEGTLSADFGSSVKIEFLPEGLICRFETRLSDLASSSEQN